MGSGHAEGGIRRGPGLIHHYPGVAGLCNVALRDPTDQRAKNMIQYLLILILALIQTQSCLANALYITDRGDGTGVITGADLTTGNNVPTLGRTLYFYTALYRSTDMMYTSWYVFSPGPTEIVGKDCADPATVQRLYSQLLPIEINYVQYGSLSEQVIGQVQCEDGEGTTTIYQFVPVVRTQTTCSITAQPGALSWGMGPDQTGLTQRAVIAYSCNQATNLSTQVNGIGGDTHDAPLGDGVNARWTWEGGQPTTAPSGASQHTLTVTPTTSGASPGIYRGSLVVTTDYQ